MELTDVEMENLLYLYAKEIEQAPCYSRYQQNQDVSSLMAELRIEKPELYRRLSCSGIPESEMKEFSTLLRLADKESLEDLDLSSVLESNVDLPPPLLQKAAEISQEESTEDGLKYLLKELPYSNCRDWYWLFMKSLRRDPTNIALRDEVAPDFEEELKKHEELKMTGGFGNRFETSDHPLENEQSRENGETTANVQLATADFQKPFDPATGIGGEVETLELRPYQEELSQHALLGQNVIICAPTGSGKTWVAVNIIKEHLTRIREQEHREPKVVFLVPTVPLVDQQTGVLRNHLRDKWRVEGIAGGETDRNKAELIFHSHVSVVTPQILLNVVNDPHLENRLSIEQFTLWVFDECHHCDQKHPYNETMILYNDIKLKRTDAVVPQVVGLTASLGVGNSDTKQMAVDHVVRMAANMAAERISTVYEQQKNLEEHVAVPKDVLAQVAATYKDSRFTVHVADMMQTIELLLSNALVNVKKQAERRNLFQGIPFTPKSKKWEVAYQGWVDLLLNKVPLLHHDSKEDIMAHLHYLKIFHLGLDFNAHIPTKQAVEFLRREMDERKRGTSDADRFCQDLFDRRSETLEEMIREGGRGIRNAMTEKLLEILEEHYEAEPDSRTIVFVRTRELTKELCRFLSETSLGALNPQQLTSVNQSQEKYGQTKVEQVAVRDAFAEGVCRLIVATSVAEEGLDITKCNLIIKYNHVSNEISLVQKKGRGRAEGSKSVLLAQEGSIADREMHNMLKEKLMKIALDLIRNAGPIWFSAQVEKKSRKFLKDRENDRKFIDRQRVALGDKKFNVGCKHCSRQICTSEEVRTVKDCHYVCVDSSVWDRCNARPLDAVKAHYQVSVAGKMACVCGEDLGNIIKYCNVFLPTLKSKQLEFTEIGTVQKRLARKWKSEVQMEMFVVRPIEKGDLVAMADRLHKTTEERLNELCREAEELQADQQRARQAIGVEVEEKEDQTPIEEE